MRKSLLFGSALLYSSCGLALAAKPEIVQTLSKFHRPESVAFSLDGKTLFVSNCASDDFGQKKDFVGLVKGRGAISTVGIDEGRATIQNLKLVEGLSGNLGLAVLPKPTGIFPAGTLLVNQGIALLVDEQGNPVTDAAALGTGVLFFDPKTGKQLGSIGLGKGSRMEQILGHITLIPNSLAFDGAGNLYVTDTGGGGERLKPPVKGTPGLIRITHAALDRIVDVSSQDVPEDGVTFTAIKGGPNGVGYWKDKEAICVVTMGGTAPEGTAVYVMPEDSFPRAAPPQPMRADVGAADGIVFTPAGTIVTSRFSGDLLAIPGKGEPVPLAIEALTNPADHRMIVLKDGSCLLAVPEQNRSDPKPWNQNLRLVKLPKGF